MNLRCFGYRLGEWVGFFSIILSISGCLQSTLTPGPPSPLAPPEFQVFYDTQSVKLREPVWFGEYPGVNGAFLVGELGGDLILLEPIGGVLKAVPFGHVPVVEVSENDGLLGLTFHPNFKVNRKYYVYYNTNPGRTVLEERMADSSFKTDAGYSRDLMTNDSNVNIEGHNGGDIHFGADGYLYLAIGDGSFPFAYITNPQDLHVLYGKMIRIDVDHQENGHEYAIPPDNPFSASSDTLIRKEIYAYGFRNPWRWSFDPLNGRLFLADVGDVVQEEVDTVSKGANYGWRIMEGNTCFNDTDEYNPLNHCDTTGLTPPLFGLGHDAISCIIGGYVFRGDASARLYGSYIFGDYATRKILIFRSLNQGSANPELFGTAPDYISSFGTDSKGNIYVVGYYTGIVYRLNSPDLQARNP